MICCVCREDLDQFADWEFCDGPVICPHCGTKLEVFSESNCDDDYFFYTEKWRER